MQLDKQSITRSMEHACLTKAKAGPFAIDIVDVFADRPGDGNPVAVVHGASSMSAHRMQALSGWIGMPETVFVLKTQDDEYSVRIFSPTRELGFAGHPSIGAVCSLIESNRLSRRTGRYRQACGSVVVELDVQSTENNLRIAFQTPSSATLREFTGDQLVELRNGLKCDSAELGSAYFVDTGARWIVARMDSSKEIMYLDPDMLRLLALSLRFNVSGVTVFAASDMADVDIEVRSFAPAIGVAEDAACGGGNACVAAVIAAENAFARESATYRASQGHCLGRKGRVFVKGPSEDKRFWIGGAAQIVSSGSILWPEE